MLGLIKILTSFVVITATDGEPVPALAHVKKNGEIHYTADYCALPEAAHEPDLPLMLKRRANPEELTALLKKYPRSFPKHCASARLEITTSIRQANGAPQWILVQPDGALTKVHAPTLPKFVRLNSLTDGVPSWPRIPLEEMIAAPRPSDLEAVYPDLARRRDILDSVTLEGRATDDGQFVWRVLKSATNSGYHFDEAALRYASGYRAPPNLKSGHATVGLAVTIIVPFAGPPKKPRY